MPDPIHQIDYAPPTGRPGWWNRRTAFFVVLLFAAITSGLIVVPRVVEKRMLLSHQANLAHGGESGIRPDSVSGPTCYTGLRRAHDGSANRLLVVSQHENGFVVLVDAATTWTDVRQSLTAERKAPPIPWNDSVEVGFGRDDPEDPSRFLIPVREAPKGSDDSRLLGHIVGHLLPDDTVTLDWQPLPAAPTTAPEPG